MKHQEIAWEPHPVAPERKSELRAAGYQILDARFKPAEPEASEQGAVYGDGTGEALPPVSQELRESPGFAPEADKPKRGRPAKVEAE